MNEHSHATRNGLICALIFAGCFWLAWPIAEMGFWDDFSYIKTAQIFSQTGHFVYNGWASPMQGWQAAWGALVIRLFGFSFTAVKLSTFPTAILTLLLFHAILVRFGITARNAILGTLTLGLSPLFLPLSASFMTDVSGLFVILLCLYCCQRAVASQSAASTIVWLSIASTSNLAGGTVRQMAWLGALVMVPSTAWLLRKRTGVLLAAVLLWVVSLACAFYCVHWFEHQPYSIPGIGPMPKGAIAIRSVAKFLVEKLLFEGLCLILLVYPILVAWLPQIRKISRRALIVIAGILLAWATVQWFLGWTLPWAPDLILNELSPARAPQMHWKFRGFFLPESVRLVISLLFLGTALIVAATFRAGPREPDEASVSTSWRGTMWLLGPFALSYFCLLALDGLSTALFDRYDLVFMPVAIVYLIRLYQQNIAPDLPLSSVLVLALYAVLAVAGTHDWFAWQRARLVAINEVLSSGVPRTEIQGGFEYDAWTQVDVGGYMNSEKIMVPPGAYKPNTDVPQVAADCRLDVAPLTPAIHPKYTVAFGPKKCLMPSSYPPVPYIGWIPPFQRTIYVQEIPSPKQ